MIDPRNDLISLFTNSRIGAASKFSGTSVYVKILVTEGQAEKEPNDYGSSYVGLIWLHPPRSYLTTIDIGYGKDEGETVVDCHLYIPLNKRWFNSDDYGTFINSVLTVFQTTIRSNQTGYVWDMARVSNIPDSLTGGNNPNVYGRVIEVVFKNID